MNLENLVNSLSSTDFKDDPFGRKDKYKVALQVLKDPGIAIRKLYSLGIPFEITVAVSGRTPQGNAYVSVNVTLTVGGQKYTMPGSSEGETPNHGIAGVQLQAINNALLRNFRMAEFQYGEIEDSTPTQGPIVTAVPPNFLQVAPHAPQVVVNAPILTTQAPQSAVQEPPVPVAHTTNGRFGAKPAGFTPKSSGKPFPEWTGELKFKSGKHIGVMYKDVPIDYLQYLANMDKPLETAIKELNRRLVLQGTPEVELQNQQAW